MDEVANDLDIENVEVTVDTIFTPLDGDEGEADYLSSLTVEDRRVASALAAVAEASVFAVAPYLRKVARSKPDFESKTDFHDIVTAHDRHAEDLFRAFFATVISESLVLGEEAGEQEAAIPVESNEIERAVLLLDEDVQETVGRLGEQVRFIVDPIDGTANFAAGLTHFGSSIAVELDGRVVAAAVSFPCTEEAIVGDADTVWHVKEDGTREEVTSTGPKTEREALLVSYYPRLSYLETNPEDALANQLKLQQAYSVVRRPGAGALDLANVAAGWVGTAFGTKFAPWDVAAGIHLIRVAGGNVLNLNMGTDLPYGLRPCVVASVGTLDANTAKQVALFERARLFGES